MQCRWTRKEHIAQHARGRHEAQTWRCHRRVLCMRCPRTGASVQLVNSMQYSSQRLMVSCLDRYVVHMALL